RRHRLRRRHTAGLPRLRVPRAHDRDDVPGLRHEPADEDVPPHGAPPCAALVSLRRGDRRRDDQRRREPAPWVTGGASAARLSRTSVDLGLCRSRRRCLEAGLDALEFFLRALSYWALEPLVCGDDV